MDEQFLDDTLAALHTQLPPQRIPWADMDTDTDADTDNKTGQNNKRKTANPGPRAQKVRRKQQ